MPVKTLSNISVTYNSQNISAYLNSASLEIIKDAIDTTNLASTAKETLPAGPGFSVPVGGFWAQALDAILGADASATSDTLRALVVVIGASGSQATYTRTASGNYGAFVSDYKVDASDPLGVITWSATLSVSGAMTRT